jgi:hypothetical protein
LTGTLPCIRIVAALAAVAIVAAGCSAANNAVSSQASSQGEQPYKTMYGISSEGTTTDLYTEFFGPRQPAPAPAAAVASAQPAQPATAQPITPVQPSATTTRQARSGQTAPGTAANRTPQAVPTQPAPVQVAQQPSPPPEPDVPTAYGITSNGPTTDLYTALFGRRDGQ